MGGFGTLIQWVHTGHPLGVSKATGGKFFPEIGARYKVTRVLNCYAHATLGARLGENRPRWIAFVGHSPSVTTGLASPEVATQGSRFFP